MKKKKGEKMFSRNLLNSCKSTEKAIEIENAIQILSVPTAFTEEAPRPDTIQSLNDPEDMPFMNKGDHLAEGIRIIRYIYKRKGLILLSTQSLSRPEVAEELEKGQCAVLTEKEDNKYQNSQIGKNLTCSIRNEELPGDILKNLYYIDGKKSEYVEPFRQIGIQSKNKKLEKYQVSPWFGYKFMIGMLPNKNGVYEPEIAVFHGMNWMMDIKITFGSASRTCPTAVYNKEKAQRLYSGWCYLYSLSETPGKKKEAMEQEFAWYSEGKMHKKNLDIGMDGPVLKTI